MPKRKIQRKSKIFSNDSFLRKRELGFKTELGFEDELCKKLTLSLESYHKHKSSNLGGIFNLEFSPNGSVLVAACEKKCISLYDSLNQKLIKNIEGAHSNCVNCVRFLDTHTFATGSDDSTIQMWDVRYLKSSTRTLRGHSNWVKNIEYSPKDNRLVTSAFDGSIYSWDLHNYTENSVIYDRVFGMDGLMRTKLSPDCTKMIICSTSGYLLIIHDLNLETLNRDLQRFKPNLYRLMQVSEQNIPAAACFNKLFSPHQKQNRVELVSDFPNEAEVISSLQIHPMGWCALTRNINSDDSSEWTCIHDIQERSERDYLNSFKLTESPIFWPQTTHPPGRPAVDPAGARPYPMDLWVGFVTNQSMRAQRMLSSSQRRGGTGIRTTRTSVTVFNSGIFPSETPADPTNGERNSQQRPNVDEVDEFSCKIVENLPRLTYYTEEPNVGKGFIKEQSFSADGRIICSPHRNGVRLFSFNGSCNELSMCVPDEPKRLNLLAHYKDYHPEIVVSCKFNPCHTMLVSGCLRGQLVWYRPKF